ncbi:hypothetical protein [Lysinibacillus fusiformis]
MDNSCIGALEITYVPELTSPFVSVGVVVGSVSTGLFVGVLGERDLPW